MTTFEAVRPLVDGQAVEVLERDERGHLVGSWLGYWNFKRGTVALYPNVKNRFANWPGGKIPGGRIVVSDRIVKCRVRNAECIIENGPTVENKGETWRDLKLPMQGQEKIQF